MTFEEQEGAGVQEADEAQAPGESDRSPRGRRGAPPTPPSLWLVFSIGLVVVVFVWFLPALWTTLNRLLGSPWLALLGVTAMAAAVGVLYLQLFRS